MSSNTRVGFKDVSINDNEELMDGTDYARKTNAFHFSKSKRASYDS